MTRGAAGGTGLSGTGSARRLEVDPERIVRWVRGFADRHGELHAEAGALRLSSASSSVTLSAADGATCVLEPFAPGRSPGGPDVYAEDGVADGSGGVDRASVSFLGSRGFETLPDWATPPSDVALILVRRGGYAVGVAQGPELVGHKVGSRYVQSRTAAGGWSQHRFARRRDNQADALVVSVVDQARRIVLAAPVDALVVGGDKSLVRDVLTDPRLARLVQLPRRELFDLPDPKLVVLKQALRRGRAVRITLTEPGSVVA